MTRWMARGRWVEPADRPLLMGILNITPDSFADEGRYATLDLALAQAERLIAEGADILDIGGESSRPGSESISTAEELDRVIPLIERLRPNLTIPISVDTTKAEVARAAIDLGVDIINDIRGLTDPALLRVVAESDVGVVIMHIRGTPRTMQLAPTYIDVVGEVAAYLAERVQVAERAGINRARIAIDPGIGFGKTFAHNQRLLRELDQLQTIGCPILVGTSRKGFLGQITGKAVADRVGASVASALACLAGGASVVRVHDVAATVEGIAVWGYQRGWTTSPQPIPGL